MLSFLCLFPESPCAIEADRGDWTCVKESANYLLICKVKKKY